MLIKICGLKSREALDAVIKNGADIAGFVFAEGKRKMEIDEAAEIARAANIKKAGVFVNETAANIKKAVLACQLDFVQLHGDETGADAAKLKNIVKAKFIKAFRYNDSFMAKAANKFPVDMVIVDAYNKSAYGGTGESFDWERAAAELKKIEKPLLVAGGISAVNVKKATELFPFAGLDVSSGVEENGVKSLEKIAEFMKLARECERRIEQC
jgi:phosphoribosylanthranilate isomerase